MQHTYATFNDPDMAQKAAGALLDNGVHAEHISIILPEKYKQDRHKSDENRKGDEEIDQITTTTAGDAMSGAATGTGVGLAAGTVAALAAVLIPGVGLVLGGGALALALAGIAGTGAAGAVAGGVTGYLKDQGVPAEVATKHGEVLKGGGALITVSPTDDDVDLKTIEVTLRKYEGDVYTHMAPTAAVMFHKNEESTTRR